MNRRIGLRARIGGALLAAWAWIGVGGESVKAADTLDNYFVNVSHATGANATIMVAPSGLSALLDAGLPNQAGRVLEVFSFTMTNSRTGFTKRYPPRANP